MQKFNSQITNNRLFWRALSNRYNSMLNFLCACYSPSLIIAAPWMTGFNLDNIHYSHLFQITACFCKLASDSVIDYAQCSACIPLSHSRHLPLLTSFPSILSLFVLPPINNYEHYHISSILALEKYILKCSYRHRSTRFRLLQWK
jgi:hypothetical protein